MEKYFTIHLPQATNSSIFIIEKAHIIMAHYRIYLTGLHTGGWLCHQYRL